MSNKQECTGEWSCQCLVCKRASEKLKSMSNGNSPMSEKDQIEYWMDKYFKMQDEYEIRISKLTPPSVEQPSEGQEELWAEAIRIISKWGLSQSEVRKQFGIYRKGQAPSVDEKKVFQAGFNRGLQEGKHAPSVDGELMEDLIEEMEVDGYTHYAERLRAIFHSEGSAPQES